ncbi:hypothetical protein [Methylobrevis pamukkalensis]|uniref:Formyltransferase/hydrolase complex Fhc subunit C n=1 Tax=Methylobrevis pamukkalensis TaxID=1439726 RepID=A0A1E3H5C9_9HYPH|nr:hypothetical protein [Methylobrevis pamukkalensis]ODN71355.1 Formyltransferase/hydrolase complex Fhc subunit C [Methylobrevis pamukkalensis]
MVTRGDCLGGARPGAMAGMAGGLVLVGGTAGASAGDRMRRGTIAILGGTGPTAGARMSGGTLLAPSFGANAGFLMRRGTMIATSGDIPSSTFVEAGMYELPFLGLLRAHLQTKMARAAHLVPARARRFRGDMAMLGKGELLISA